MDMEGSIRVLNKGLPHALRRRAYWPPPRDPSLEWEGGVSCYGRVQCEGRWKANQSPPLFGPGGCMDTTSG